MGLTEYKDVLTVKNVSEILCVCIPTVYKLIESGELYARKVGKNYRIPKNALIKYIYPERSI